MAKFDNINDDTPATTTLKKADAFINMTLVTKSGVKQQAGAIAVHKDSKDAGIRSYWMLIEAGKIDRLQQIFGKSIEIRVVIVDQESSKGPLTLDEI